MKVYHIAICDDCEQDRKRMENLILNHSVCPERIIFYEYLSGDSLLKDFQAFDAIILDIQMEGLDGKKTAEEIRKKDSRVPLAFCTGFEGPTTKTFRVRPICYLMKDSDEAEMNEELGRLLEEMIACSSIPALTVTGVGMMFVVELRDILYIEIYNKASRVYLTRPGLKKMGFENVVPQDMPLRCNKRLAEIYAELKDYGFSYAHKSYIVNLENVVGKRKNTVILKDEVILNVSRSHKNDFDLELSRYRGVRFMRRRAKTDD